MTYVVLSLWFFSSVAMVIIVLVRWVLILCCPHFLGRFRVAQVILSKNRTVSSITKIWFTLYFIFIVFFTGPSKISLSPRAVDSPYKLPWQYGVARFVSQGHRSFTSHRDFSEFSWDFWMPIGTPILAARKGEVIEVEDRLSGIGFKSNFIKIKHDDQTVALYAHIQTGSARWRAGDYVEQGSPIALAGMVGQTINPHLHFAVINSQGSSTMPIAFSDVNEGIPRAGYFYKSGNKNLKADAENQ